MPSISVVIPCANVADTIEAACRSARWADEVIVIDSGSTDRTGDIARHYADRYLVEPWRGYRGQIEFAVAQATHPWVLWLDGDEECGDGLGDEIGRLPAARLDHTDVFAMRRRHFLFGRVVRSWEPDWVRRLVRRDAVRWTPHRIHSGPVSLNGRPPARLDGRVLHRRHSQADFRGYFNGALEDRLLAMAAADLSDAGVRCRWHDLAVRPSATFLKHYVWRRGFLDGLFGLAIAQKAARAEQLRYAALWAYERGISIGDTRRATPDSTRSSARH